MSTEDSNNTGATEWTYEGVPFSTATVDEAIALISDSAQAHSPSITVRLVNAYSLTLAMRNQHYLDLLRSPGLNLVDGRPVAWLGSTQGAPSTGTRGPTLFREMLASSAHGALRHYFLGGSADTLARLTANLQQQNSALIIAGAKSPPFRPLSLTEQEVQDEEIRQSRPDVIWIGLGTPKQDFEAARITRALGITTVAVGAAFDFAAGVKPEAPKWLQDTGLEWIFRLITEPRRLWHRYLIGNFRFLRLLARSLRGAHSSRP